MNGKYNDNIQKRHQELAESAILKSKIQSRRTYLIYISILTGSSLICLLTFNSVKFFDFLSLDKRYKSYIDSRNKKYGFANADQVELDQKDIEDIDSSTINSEIKKEENPIVSIYQRKQIDIKKQTKLNRDARQPSVSIKFDQNLNSSIL